MVWGFVQKEDDKKFRAGDILKGWVVKVLLLGTKLGNVIDGDLSWVRWTGRSIFNE